MAEEERCGHCGKDLVQIAATMVASGLEKWANEEDLDMTWLELGACEIEDFEDMLKRVKPPKNKGLSAIPRRCTFSPPILAFRLFCPFAFSLSCSGLFFLRKDPDLSLPLIKGRFRAMLQRAQADYSRVNTGGCRGCGAEQPRPRKSCKQQFWVYSISHDRASTALRTADHGTRSPHQEVRFEVPDERSETVSLRYSQVAPTNIVHTRHTGPVPASGQLLSGRATNEPRAHGGALA
jgi:hypothetical protein